MVNSLTFLSATGLVLPEALGAQHWELANALPFSIVCELQEARPHLRMPGALPAIVTAGTAPPHSPGQSPGLPRRDLTVSVISLETVPSWPAQSWAHTRPPLVISPSTALGAQGDKVNPRLPACAGEAADTFSLLVTIAAFSSRLLSVHVGLPSDGTAREDRAHVHAPGRPPEGPRRGWELCSDPRGQALARALGWPCAPSHTSVFAHHPNSSHFKHIR